MGERDFAGVAAQLLTCKRALRCANLPMRVTFRKGCLVEITESQRSSEPAVAR
jgi:hypothetical protein